MVKYVFEAIGTHWEIEWQEDTALKQLEKKPFTASNKNHYQRHVILKEILQLIEDFDQTYSRFRTDSLVYQMSQQSGTYLLPAHAWPLLTLYWQLYQMSGGVFTPLIGQLLVDAGYDHQYSLQPKTLHPVPQWETVCSWPGFVPQETPQNTLLHISPNTPQQLILHQPALLDFGAGGKGYLVDLVARILLKANIKNFCIDAGGDIFYHTAEEAPLRVGLENPHNSNQVLGVAEIKKQSICGSAGNRRAWQNFHHIMDPKKQQSTQGILASWVIADSALLADSLATALFLVPASKLQTAFSFEYLILYNDSHVQQSDSFPAELFYQNYQESKKL